MRTISLIFSCVLVSVLLLTGCGVSAPAETTVPTTAPAVTAAPETTEPPETTLPPETTEPEETVVLHECPCHQEYFDAQFVVYAGSPEDCNEDGCALCFRYEGTDSTIYHPVLNITLTLPEGWLDQVYVFADSDGLYVDNSALLDAGLKGILGGTWDETGEASDEEIDYAKQHCKYAFILKIERVDKSVYDTDGFPRSDGYDPYENPVDGIFLWEDESDYWYAVIDGDELYAQPRWYIFWPAQAVLGEESFDEARASLTLDYDTVREMVTIHNEIAPSE